jgi:hypothetical protein
MTITMWIKYQKPYTLATFEPMNFCYIGGDDDKAIGLLVYNWMFLDTSEAFFIEIQ